MKIKIFSDLHLTSFNPKKTDDELCNYIKEDGYDMIILLGDIYDTLKRDTFEPFIKEYNDIKEIYPKFSNLIFYEDNIRYIKGNHDRIVPHIEDTFDIKFNNYKIHFEHGHEGDEICKNNSCCCGCACGVFHLGQIEKKNKMMADLIYQLEDPNISKKKLRDYAYNYKNCNMIVLGHSHLTDFIKFDDDRYYINSGTSRDDDMDEIVLDIDLDKINNVNSIKIYKNLVNIHTLQRKTLDTQEIKDLNNIDDF